MLKHTANITIFIQSAFIIAVLLMAVGALWGMPAGYFAVTWTQTISGTLVQHDAGFMLRLLQGVFSGFLAALAVAAVSGFFLLLWVAAAWRSASLESAITVSSLLAWLVKAGPCLPRALRLFSLIGAFPIAIVTGILIQFVPDTTPAGMPTSIMRTVGAASLGLITTLSLLVTGLTGRRIASIASESWTTALVGIAYGFAVMRVIGSAEPCAYIAITLPVTALLIWLYSWSQPQQTERWA